MKIEVSPIEETLEDKITRLEKIVYLLSRQVFSNDEYSSFNTEFGQISVDTGNIQALESSINWINNYFLEKDASPKGLYFLGPFGVGKTMAMEAIVNELSLRHVPAVLAYVPDFVRKIKESFKNGDTDTIVHKIKNVPVLILDDIGAENVTPFIRDEILGPILHFRIKQKLPTHFTSNYDLEELELHFRGDPTVPGNSLRAAKIMEYITPYVDSVTIMRKNARRL